jgi:hypothetical protein
MKQVNMADEEPTQALGFTKKDVSGFTQKVRAKRNVEYTSPSGEQFFAKYATLQPDRRNNIEGLKREKQFLDRLAPTGVVPKAGELKIYPNEQKARLLLEMVAGESLDSGGNLGFYLKAHPEETIQSTAEAHSKVLEKDVAVVDVNQGTYLLNRKDGELNVKVLDLELAVDLNQLGEDDKQRALRWYQGHDIWLRMREGNISDYELQSLIRREDIHHWAIATSEWLLGSRANWEARPSSPDKIERYNLHAEMVQPIIEAELRAKAAESYDKYSPEPKSPEQRARMIEHEVDSMSKFSEREALSGLLLEDQLKAKGINLPPEMVRFMEEALDPDIDERPESFDELTASKNISVDS